MPTAPYKPEPFLRENRGMTTYLLLGIKLRIVRQVFGFTQAEMAQKFGMTLAEYKKLEESQHAPDCEKSFKLVGGGAKGFTAYDARTRVTSEIVDLLLPRPGRDE